MIYKLKQMNLRKFEKFLKWKHIDVNLRQHKTTTLKSLSIFLKDITNINTHTPLFKNLINLLKYDIGVYDITKRLNLISELKNDGLSNKSLLLRYGEEEGNRRIIIRKESFSYKSSKQYYIDKYGEEEAIKRHKSKAPNNIELLKQKHPDKWEEKWNTYLTNYKK